MSLFEIKNLTMTFGGLCAINDFSMSLDKGEIRGLIGPNGAGKTTMFNVISGWHQQTSGEIFFKDIDISRLKPHRVARLGLVRTFQAVTLFKNFTSLKNVMMGCHLHSGYKFWGALVNSPTTRAAEETNRQKSLEILKFMELDKYKEELAINLPHGHQRALGISIALAANPELLMLDEPCAGMNTEETDFMVDLIKKIRDRGISILLIEHDMKVVMGICDKITVINFGNKIAEGTPNEIQNSPDVHEAYLGGENNIASGGANYVA